MVYCIFDLIILFNLVVLRIMVFCIVVVYKKEIKMIKNKFGYDYILVLWFEISINFKGMIGM